MGRILTLDQNMVNTIAAGEVVERPASVVKELMENSLDAGATQIVVSIEDGGRKLIAVRDNGCGMDAEDLDKAFEPHSTSKIRTREDLARIATLGFRGEALASIASVAHVQAVSRTRDSDLGYSIEIDCGRKSPVRPCSASHGTYIVVRDLFYKLPARRKFLRTANTEMGHIVEQFTRIALGCWDMPAAGRQSPDAGSGGATYRRELILTHNGNELYRLDPDQGPAERVARLFPALTNDPAKDFVEARWQERTMQIFALLGKPTLSRTSSRFQYVFLNGRFIRDKFISHAIREAYRGLLEPERFPVVFLFLRMPYDAYDINVHPTKIEVRFYDANLVHSQVLGALRETLLGTALDTPGKLPATPPGHQRRPSESAVAADPRIVQAMAEFFEKHRSTARQRQLDFDTAAPIRSQVQPPTDTDRKNRQQTATAHPGQKKYMQIHDSYIVAETDQGFMVIDQHALHERILYEDLKRRISRSPLESQRLLIPQSFELNDAQAQCLQEHKQLLERLGIEIVPFGPRRWAVQAFPTLLSKVRAEELILDLIELLEDSAGKLPQEQLLDNMLEMAACKAAIKAGQKLSDTEIDQLLAHKDETACSSRCPHGRPTTIQFSLKQLEKQFKRS